MGGVYGVRVRETSRDREREIMKLFSSAGKRRRRKSERTSPDGPAGTREREAGRNGGSRPSGANAARSAAGVQGRQDGTPAQSLAVSSAENGRTLVYSNR